MIVGNTLCHALVLIYIKLQIRITHKFFKLGHDLRIIFIFIYLWNFHFEFRTVSRKHHMWVFEAMAMCNAFLKDFVYLRNWVFGIRSL